MPKVSSSSERGENFAGWLEILREVDESALEKKTSVDYLRTQDRFSQFVSAVDPKAVACRADIRENIPCVHVFPQ